MTKMTMKEFEKNSYLAGVNAAYIEELYEKYLLDPEQVDLEWRDYFDSLAQADVNTARDISHEAIRNDFRQLAKQSIAVSTEGVAADSGLGIKQVAVNRLIEAHRRFGHLNANLDPLGFECTKDPRLQLEHYGLSEADLNTQFLTGELLESHQAPLREILKAVKSIYTSTIGVQYSTISDEEERHWLREYVERRIPKMQFGDTLKKNILQQLVAAEEMEKYLNSKYVGQKRFSVEGADSLIPMLDELAKRACQQGMKEVVIGMAHRGRLNVLLNVMGHSPKEMFLEFEGKKEYGMTSGDVKYHRGYSRDVLTDAGPIHLALAFNPSHLEFINSVIMGSVRARQGRYDCSELERFDKAMPVQIHGDAAFAGQGVVMETLSMSQTRAHTVGGSLHIIINNQIGFTTSNPQDARSSHYCTDIAKMLDAPIFHVNADDPEAVVSVTQLALDYRMKFHKDVFIDLVCYRRHGHQEVDEPTATQPIMYNVIREHPTTKTQYAKHLIKQEVCTEEEVEKFENDYRQKLEKGEQTVQTLPSGLSKIYAENWAKYIGGVWSTPVDLTVPIEKLKELGGKVTSIPEHFKLQRQVANIMKHRIEMAKDDRPLDWGFAENMAYATLLVENHPVRLVGEDSRRGTFGHRHAVFHDQKTGEEYMPLSHLSEDQAHVQIYDSLLSEAAALGFEYGYATAEPRGLTIWEAQFGDFANGAQVIIDQFISSGWQKWNRLSGVTLLLPHGYEGMGPEHSSARLERYLQLCAQYNIQVCVPTTPAQIYHLLRRQALRPFRKPLIVMTPKSLLRHKLATSTMKELQQGNYELILPEIDDIDPDKVSRLILCSGKVYYDLLKKRRDKEIDHAAIIRIEQLYPFPYDELSAQIQRYSKAKTVVWAQEEPKNQGAWFTGRHRLVECMTTKQTLIYAGRDPTAAPAVGYPALHKQQQELLVNRALGLEAPGPKDKTITK